MKMKSLLKKGTPAALVIAGSLFCGSQAFAQLKVGDNPTTINVNSALEVESSSKGILYPRVALSGPNRPLPLAAHVEGMQVYNTVSNDSVQPGNYYNDGTKWLRVITSVPEGNEIFGSGAPSGSCTTGTTYTDTLETSGTAGQQWTCVASAWKAFVAPNSTPFLLNSSSKDAGSNKYGAIYRFGALTLRRQQNNWGYSQLSPGGVLKLMRTTSIDAANGGIIQFGNTIADPNRFSIALRTNVDNVLAFQAGGSPKMVITEAGKIGIGTTTPDKTLHVRGPGQFSGPSVPTGNFSSGTASSDGILLDYDGTPGTNIAVQNSSTASNLNLSKSTAGAQNDRYISFNANGSTIGYIFRSGNTPVMAFGPTSDRRLKENIKETHYSISDVMKIGVMDYNYKNDKTKTRTTGFIAQDLYKILPDAVRVGGANEKTDPWVVDYSKVTPLLVKAVQDQQREIASLKAQLLEMNSLKEEVASIKSLLGKAEMIKDMPAK